MRARPGVSRPSEAEIVEAAEWRPHLWAPVIGDAVSAPALDGWSGKRVLEIGFGRGRYAALLASLGARVTGIEITDRTLAVARSHADVCGVSDACEFLVGDFFSLERTFDRIVTKSVLYSCATLEDYDAWLSRFVALLNPGGDVLLIENGSGTPPVRFYRRWLHRYRRYADFVLSSPELLPLYRHHFRDVVVRPYYRHAPLLPGRLAARLERRWVRATFEECFVFWMYGRRRDGGPERGIA